MCIMHKERLWSQCWEDEKDAMGKRGQLFSYYSTCCQFKFLCWNSFNAPEVLNDCSRVWLEKKKLKDTFGTRLKGKTTLHPAEEIKNPSLSLIGFYSVGELNTLVGTNWKSLELLFFKLIIKPLDVW